MKKLFVFFAAISLVGCFSTTHPLIGSTNSQDNLDDIYADMGIDKTAPTSKPEGEFLIQGDATGDVSDLRYCTTPRHVDRRMKVGQVIVSSWHMKFTDFFFHSFSRTTVNEVNFAKEEFVKTVEDLRRDGVVYGWSKERCTMKPDAAYSFDCVQLDASENRKVKPAPEPKPNPTPPKKDTTKNCYFRGEYSKETSESKVGDYRFRNGVVVPAYMVISTRPGNMECEQGDIKTIEGTATNKTTTIYSMKVPDLGTPSCEQATEIFSYSEVMDQAGKIRDVSKNEFREFKP